MCQVAHCALHMVCTTHSCAQPWAMAMGVALGKAIRGHKWWGPVGLATGGGLGTPKARPGPPVGHPTTPSHCMPALVGPLGLGVHWVWPPGAHTTPPWVQWGAQGDTMAQCVQDPGNRLGTGTVPSLARLAWNQSPRVLGQPWTHGSKAGPPPLDPCPHRPWPICPQRPKLGPSQAPNLGPCIGQATQACMQHTQPQKNIRNLPQKHQCFTIFSRWAQKFKIARPDLCPGLQRHGSKVDPRGSKLLPRSSKFWFQAAPPRIQACGAHHFFVPRGP